MSNNIKQHTVLITGAREDTGHVHELLKERDLHALHLPLERYVEIEDEREIDDALEDMSEYENIIVAHKRSALFYVDALKKRDKIEEARQQLNLTMKQETADYLESNGIPAVLPGEETEPIKLVEFMLRLKRTGKTLYPCGSHLMEDIPGFLEELDMPVLELPLFDLEGPEDSELEDFREQVRQKDPEILVFHSRRSVTRLTTAFPKLEYENKTVVSADSAVTEKLSGNDIETDLEAEGSWQSIVEVIAEETR